MKKRLGRGLSSVMAQGMSDQGRSKIAETEAPKALEKAAETTAATDAGIDSQDKLIDIPLARIVPNPHQPRRDSDPAAISVLAASIRSEGLLQPIIVRKVDETYQLIVGERRWRAFQQLELPTIPARVMQASDASSAVMALIENLQRKDLNPIQEALGYASLMRDFDLTQEAVAQRIGKARATITNALRLLKLERTLQGYLAKGLLTVGHAKVLLGLEDPAQQLLLARRIIEHDMSIRATETAVERLRKEVAVKTARRPLSLSQSESIAVKDLGERLTAMLKAKVILKHSGAKGKLVIEYHSNDELQRILEKMGWSPQMYST